MTAAFHYAATVTGNRAVVEARNDNAEKMLCACGFKWDRSHQRYSGERTRLQGMELLIDAGYVPYLGDLAPDDMGPSEPVEYAKVVREVRRARVQRCRRTLELFKWRTEQCL